MALIDYDITLHPPEYVRPEFLAFDIDKYNNKFPWIKYKYVFSLGDGSPVYEERPENEIKLRIKEVDDYYEKKNRPVLIQLPEIPKSVVLLGKMIVTLISATGISLIFWLLQNGHPILSGIMIFIFIATILLLIIGFNSKSTKYP